MGSPPRYEWSDDMLNHLCFLKSRRYSNYKIARTLSKHLFLNISEAMVSDCWNRLIDCGYFEDKPHFKLAVDRTIKNRARKLEGGLVKCPRRATLLHLLDLKRAGHSPRHTELKIDGDFWPKRLEASGQIRSYCGSSSYLCAMEG